jgi:glutaminyl-peptide cyclotransferase
MKHFILLLAAALHFAGPAQAAPPRVCSYEVVKAYPHDPRAFTQGLLYRDGHLVESTGLEGRSTIRKVRLEDGAVLKQAALPPALFGEGIVDWKDQLVSVTWHGGKGFRWDARTLRKLGEFSYSGEGWGLTQDGRNLILSDGTAVLRFLDPATMKVVKRLTVAADGRPVRNLNELEWVKGEIFANVWMTDLVARIDPRSGNVKSVINLSGLRRSAGAIAAQDVLNGIAYDAKGDRLFVTGKNWPKLFQIKIKGC